MNKKHEHLAWLELLRVAAALAVVVVHVAYEPVVSVADRDSALWHAGNFFDSLARWCIGIFIMVSGALLLEPAQSESFGEFLRKRVQRLFIPVIFWMAAYYALSAAQGRVITPRELVGLTWENSPWGHMWYFAVLIGLYAITPLLRAYVSRASTALRWSIVLVSLSLASMWDLYLSIRNQMLPSSVVTMFIPYLGYYLIGYELRKLAPAGPHSSLLWVAFVGGAICTVAGSYILITTYGITRLGLYMYEYLSPNVILMSVALFSLASKVGDLGIGRQNVQGAIARGVMWIGPLTLGIYLCHPMVLLGFRKLGYHVLGTGSVFGVLLVAIPAFTASLALTWAMARVPILRQAVGFR